VHGEQTEDPLEATSMAMELSADSISHLFYQGGEYAQVQLGQQFWSGRLILL
jgi:hypothetical protein